MLGAFVVGIIAGLVVGVVDRSVDYGGRVFDFVFCGMFVGCLWLAFDNDNHVVSVAVCAVLAALSYGVILTFLSRRTRCGE
jgi:predicted branched-subunit amino acid permease